MEPIPNQPAIFGYNDNCVCPELPPQLVNWGDNTDIQFEFDACPDAENILNTPWGDWTLGTGWAESYSSSDICHTGSASSAAEVTSALTIGLYYKVTFTVSGLSGSGCYAYGLVDVGYAFTIEANGTYTWFGEAASTTFGFFAPADVEICIENTIAIYEVNVGFQFWVYKDSDDSNVAIIETDDPADLSYYTIRENTVTLHVSWADLGIGTGCYYLTYQDPCEGLTEIQSNRFKLGDWPCTVMVNACSESNNNGFVFESTGFVPKIRLDAALVPASPEIVIEKYTDSAGKRTTYFGNRRKFNKLRIGFEPEYVHNFLSLLGQLDHVYVDGVEYFVEDDDYQLIEDDNLPCLPQATITISKKTEKVESNLCVEPSGEGCEVSCDGEYEETEYDNDEYFTC